MIACFITGAIWFDRRKIRFSLPVSRPSGRPLRSSSSELREVSKAGCSSVGRSDITAITIPNTNETAPSAASPSRTSRTRSLRIRTRGRAGSGASSVSRVIGMTGA